ncbi:DNA (cytosine-5)-methyltransferase 1B [Camellia lanceoleosa]|uniref:DNA (Cytosine-5)-methyltransferase 1B n=1 Tax=Camellia lanceoleosa TaxID=1840588 RepID=A0ACC0FLT3_9ERIC|nr:DNA (cytosine-5)-methyltransferase 1B [Camellia lanceoleosa]
MEYNDEPVSWLQMKIREDTLALTDHISIEMNELNLIWCQRIPRRLGADWRDLPDEKGFSDGYKFAGNIQHKYRQIGNVVPPLAFALGSKLKEAVERKW